MSGRVFVVLTAAVAGLFFAPVFGLLALVPSIAVVALLVFAVAELCTRRPSLEAWRPVLAALAGLVGIVETVLFPTTAAGFPTWATVGALGSGITESWQLALQSTWPARPDAGLVLFVPLLVLVAAVFGVEVVVRLRRPLPALLPSFAVIVVSQLYSALAGVGAVVAALGYAAVAGALLVVTGRSPERSAEDGTTLLPVVPVLVLGGVAGIVAGVVLPTHAPAYSLKQDQVALVSARLTSPLDEVSYRLTHPDAPVFAVSGASADRWPVVVLDTFDGVNWSPGGRYRRLGTELPRHPSVTVPTTRREATISVREPGGRWLPSQTWPAAVTGTDPLVEESQGTLLTQRPLTVPTEYGLSWWAPELGGIELNGAAVDPYAQGGQGGIGVVPDGIAELARQAVHDLRPSFQAALQLERFLRDGYKVAVGDDLPSGHGWPQLRRFLLETKQGTSEQFAAAYVVLARMTGIPARLVVGYRTPEQRDGEYTVHNGDVAAWPEVAVAGVGWVPLDPDRRAATGSGTGGGLAAATAQAREVLPSAEELQDPAVAPGPEGEGAGQGDSGPFPIGLVLLCVAAAAVLWFGGIPLAKGVRSLRRRSKPGAAGVLGAWQEVRDRLREHQVPFTAGMTPRDLAAAAARAGRQSTVDAVLLLGTAVDLTLWSGTEPDEDTKEAAWTAVYTVRRRLARRGLAPRLKAAVDPRTLFSR